MSTNSKIEWTGSTWNPVVGCTRVSAGCDHCYAVGQSFRNGEMGSAKYKGLTVLNPKGDRHFNGVVRCVDDALDIPLKRKKPTTYFVNSMSDLFHKDVPFEFIDKVFAVMAVCGQQHTFQILTKRPERMCEYLLTPDRNKLIATHGWAFVDGYSDMPIPNVWLGTSIENRAALYRLDHLRSCRAAVRFLSLEPLLEDLGTLNLSGIHWVIVGGESGGSKKSPARVCYTNWIDSIVAQCKAANVPVFVKQLGSNHRCIDDEFGDVEIKLKSRKGGDIAEFPADLRIREMPVPV